ncbi:hypothetical protein KUCAC02_034004 [Chaenocephalus aceratus]|nr:hypothetical protein KUCAC02_034004 [Chaenocephalus aceratus]
MDLDVFETGFPDGFVGTDRDFVLSSSDPSFPFCPNKVLMLCSPCGDNTVQVLKGITAADTVTHSSLSGEEGATGRYVLNLIWFRALRDSSLFVFNKATMFLQSAAAFKPNNRHVVMTLLKQELHAGH